MNNTSQEFAINIKREVMEHIHRFSAKIDEVDKMKARIFRIQENI
jgi:hypothetical protein